MFIHIGDGHIINSENIIVMIDQQYVDSSSINEELIEHQKEQESESTIDQKTKTIVVTKKDVYYSPLTIQTLKKRTSLQAMIDHLNDYTDQDILERE